MNICLEERYADGLVGCFMLQSACGAVVSSCAGMVVQICRTQPAAPSHW